MESDNIDAVQWDDIMDFDTFMELKEKEQIGRKDGVFKITFDSAHLNADADTVLDIVLSRVCGLSHQVLSKGHSQNIYQYSTLFASPKEKSTFIKEASEMSSYATETCCSSILKDHGSERLLLHFFENEVQQHVEATQCGNGVDEAMKTLISQGVVLRNKYFGSSIDHLMATCLKKKGQSEPCNCQDCMDVANSEDEDNYKNPGCGEPFSLYACGISPRRKDPPIFITKSFSLSRLKNILLLLDYFYPGLSLPYFYVGTKHSFFPLHVEDCSLWGINFLHFGQPKIWIVVPPEAVLSLMYHLQKSKLSINDTSCWNFLGHKNAFPDPTWLQERGIPYKVVVQNAGEALVLYPNAAHFGFNTGWNLAEAINFATISWIEEGIRAPRCQCTQAPIHLDLGKIIAAFRPELLPQWMKGTYVRSHSEEEMARMLLSVLKVPMESSNQISSTSGDGQEEEAGGDNLEVQRKPPTDERYLECPMPLCKRRYPFNAKKKLEAHVQNKHRPLVVKYNYLEKISEQHINMKKKR